jgi:transposase InsO family protein
MVRKRLRKKLPVAERMPLIQPEQPGQVWSMDFVFDELANGRKVKTLTVVDDCSIFFLSWLSSNWLVNAASTNTLGLVWAES